MKSYQLKWYNTKPSVFSIPVISKKTE